MNEWSVIRTRWLLVTGEGYVVGGKKKDIPSSRPEPLAPRLLPKHWRLQQKCS